MQETAYEPLILNVPLLGGFAGAEDRACNGEKTSTDDLIVVVEGDLPSPEPLNPTAGEQSPPKKRRTIRFAES